MLSRKKYLITILFFTFVYLFVTHFLLSQYLPRMFVGDDVTAKTRQDSGDDVTAKTRQATSDEERALGELYFRRHIIDLGPMCVGTYRTIIFVADEDHEAALRGNPPTNYTFPTKMLSNLAFLPKKMRTDTLENVLFWRQNSRTYSYLAETNASLTGLPPPPPLVNGTGLILDNGVGAYQFGHTMNMYIPLITLLENEKLNFVSHLVDFLFLTKEQAPRWHSEVINSLIDDVVLKSTLAKKRSNLSPSFQLRNPELNSGELEVTCFDHVAKIYSPERYFESASDAELFHNAIRRAYPCFQPRLHSSCPPQKAIVLYRSGLGQGLRRILNYDAVNEALFHNLLLLLNSSSFGN